MAEVKSPVEDIVRYILIFLFILIFIVHVFITLINPEGFFFGKKPGGTRAVAYLLANGVLGLLTAYLLGRGKNTGTIAALLYSAYNFTEVLVTNAVAFRSYSISPLFSTGLVFSIALYVIQKNQLKIKNLQPVVEHTRLLLAGIIFVMLSNIIGVLIWSLMRPHGNDPFYFPVAFVMAAAYGWYSRNYYYGFFVGFFSVPYVVPFPPYYSISVVYVIITNVFGLTSYNLLDLSIFLLFGIASGFIGIGFAKWHKIIEQKG
ncbi:MAG: hypothetical protein OIN66_16790 [Candidatus Methanoperedens sp.]|nr:hypothetical protein [Candidatus Methanoperedens sp.]